MTIEIELQNKKVPYIKDGTYRFASDDTTTVGLMETLVAVLPMWKVGHVDDEVASKYRTFEDVSTDQNILSFLLDDVQDAYECIVLFDIMNRVINVYDQANFVHQTDIHLTRDDLVKSIDTVNENVVVILFHTFDGVFQNILTAHCIEQSCFYAGKFNV